MTINTCQVIVLGAGPYGLSAAAHLRSANIDVRVFGRVMEFWQCQMPAGMFLRSSWEASYIAYPDQTLTLDAYEQAQGIQLPRPVPLEDFLAYGRWYQHRAVPSIDPRLVHSIAPVQGGLRVSLEDGESLQAQRVVIAAGIAPFTYRPPEFDDLPPDLVSHSADHHDLTGFADQRVAVVGGGQSAIESAALLHEVGANVEVIARAPRIRWLRRSAWLHNHLRPVQRLLYPPTDVGPPVLNQIVARPRFFKGLPLKVQEKVAYRSIRPAAAGWLWPRVQDVRVTTSRNITSAQVNNGGLRLALDDGSHRDVDHAFLATGYRVNVAQYPFLSPEVKASLRCVNGYPELSAGFESSVPGLHFVGAPAAWSFGPLMRFVSGTGYTMGALTHYIATRNANGGHGNGKHR